MRFTHLIVLALGSGAVADVLVLTGDTFPSGLSIKDGAQLSSIGSKLQSALLSAHSTRAANPTAASLESKLGQYFVTRSDVPLSAITDPNVASIITTVPPWITAMPTDVRSYYESSFSADYEIAKSVLVEAGVLSKGLAPAPTRVGILGAGVAAAVGAVLMM